MTRDPEKPRESPPDSERRHRVIFAHERDAMSVFDAKTHQFIDVNEAWIELYGYTREEALGMTPADVSDEQEATRSSIDERASGGGSRRIDLRWHRKKNGTRFPVELSCGRVDVGGREAMYAVIRDISERVAADEALRRSEAGFRSLIEGMPYAVFVHRFGQLVYANPAGLELVGYTEHADELLGREVIEFVHPEEREMVARRVAEYMKQGKTAPAMEERFLRRDGSFVTVEVTGIPVEFDGEPAALALVRDLSLRKRMEAQLVTADRLASLGRLAASVGHEINNPLSYVLGNAQMLQRELDEAGVDPGFLDKLKERLSAIIQGSERMRDVVRDLKTLARSEDERHGVANLHRVLDVCTDMAAHEVRHRARLVKAYGEPALVEASEGRLGQIFLNLLVNAAQAIPEGNVFDNEVRITTGRAGNGDVLVEISDSGVGIPDDALERIFEPFYSTKGPGGGTGLGLSICHHLVTSLGGSIEVGRRVPRGTTFRVTLPRAEGPEVGASRPAPVPEPVVGARVVVIDDEERLTELLATVLDGYEVTVAHSGRQAIELFDRGEPFDVVLCDLMMGDLTGMDVYEHLARTRTGAEHRIVFMTGGAFTPRAAQFLESVDNLRLHKPFSTSSVLRVIHALMSETAE